MKAVITGVDHDAFREEVTELLRKHGEKLDQQELLALLSQMVGQMVAVMDQRRFTPAGCFAIIKANIEAGNKGLVDSLLKSKGRMQ